MHSLPIRIGIQFNIIADVTIILYVGYNISYSKNIIR